MVLNASVVEFETFEDYLDSQITDTDMYYLEDKDLARQLVELGYRGSGEPLKREEFDTRKKLLSSNGVPLTENEDQETLVSAGKEQYWNNDAFLTALAEREELNRNGKMMTILFIRLVNSKGHEVSGYIDYGHRLKTDDNAFEHIFKKTKKLIPKSSDLSYYNWMTRTTTSNNSPNFNVVTDNEEGILFKSKKDRKIINVDPNLPNTNDGFQRTVIETQDYLQVVIYDHLTRRKV